MIDLAGNLQILSKDEIKNIHYKSLEILENIGLEVKNKKILQLLKDKGVKIDKDKSVVYLSKTLVEKAIQDAPTSVTLYSRNGKDDLHLSSTNVYIGTG